MSKRLTRPMKDLLRDARTTLSMTQAEFGPALGWSHRSAVRWERGHAHPTEESLATLASLLMPVDPELAAEAALAAGESLESLGLATPKAAPPQEKPVRRTTPGDLADADHAAYVLQKPY